MISSHTHLNILQIFSKIFILSLLSLKIFSLKLYFENFLKLFVLSPVDFFHFKIVSFRILFLLIILTVDYVIPLKVLLHIVRVQTSMNPLRSSPETVGSVESLPFCFSLTCLFSFLVRQQRIFILMHFFITVILHSQYTSG